MKIASWIPIQMKLFHFYGPRFIWKQKQFLSSMILVNQGILAIALGTTR